MVRGNDPSPKREQDRKIISTKKRKEEKKEKKDRTLGSGDEDKQHSTGFGGLTFVLTGKSLRRKRGERKQ